MAADAKAKFTEDTKKDLGPSQGGISNSATKGKGSYPDIYPCRGLPDAGMYTNILFYPDIGVDPGAVVDPSSPNMLFANTP